MRASAGSLLDSCCPPRAGVVIVAEHVADPDERQAGQGACVHTLCVQQGAVAEVVGHDQVGSLGTLALVRASGCGLLVENKRHVVGAVDILLDEGILQGPAVSAERVPCCLALHHRPKNQAGVVLGQRDAGAHVLDGCVHAGGVGRPDGAVQAEQHEPKQLGHRELIIKHPMNVPRDMRPGAP